MDGEQLIRGLRLLQQWYEGYEIQDIADDSFLECMARANVPEVQVSACVGTEGRECGC